MASFIVDPAGEIHGSVLAAFGEILSFAGAVMGFDYYNRKTLFRMQKARDAIKEQNYNSNSESDES